MLSQVASQFQMIWLTCIGLLIFFSVFLGVVAWAFRKGSGELYQEIAASTLGLKETETNKLQNPSTRTS